ncbi:MAG: bifunctional oligoribonuclease/PAP phosphatase NrnA [candidate division NC10 bacterium]|nr:bifunctional oligoribonuclease/PAP phosphatase NrnA [candidate division NC10 bacterium]
MGDFPRMVEVLRAARRVAVLSHINPEADCIGAALGCTLALKEQGKAAMAYNADPLPRVLRFLPGAADLVQATRLPEALDCVVVVDSSNPERVGGLLTGVAAPVLNVDHHKTNVRFGTLNWVVPGASSAGEMVFHLLRALGYTISAPVAINLYAAILTDTGSFHYKNTTPEALRVAAALLEAGALPAQISSALYEQRDAAELRLLSRCLGTLKLSRDGRVAWMEVTAGDLAEGSLTPDALEGFIDYPCSIAGVEVAVLFKALTGDGIRVSLRSRGRADVAAVAATFGGGGHRNAAGCQVPGDPAAARDAVLEAVERGLTGAGGKGRG